MSTSLTWGLLICTYKRELVLHRAVRLALTQTRPPNEVVIVDTSPDWEGCRDRFAAELGPLLGDTKWQYLGSTRNSLPCKRNIAIDASSSDIAFLVDDDSLMYPDCAEEVMKVYEADGDRQIAGVTMTDMDVPPDAPAESRPSNGGVKKRQAPAILLRLEHALAEQRLRFLPYDGSYHQRELPPELAKLGVVPQALIGGFRMTFRRDVIADAKFPEYLEGYAVGEDFDASYRASRMGALVLAPRARVHHLIVAGGRPNRPLKTGFTCLNVIAMNVLHAPPNVDVRRRCWQFALQRTGIALATDVGRLRLRFPDTKGMLFAWQHLGDILERSGADLESWYLAFQRQHLSA